MAHSQLKGLPLQRLKRHSAQHLTENSCLMEHRMINAIIKHLPFSPVSSMDSEEWKGKQWKDTVRLPETDFSHTHFFLNLGMTNVWGGSHCDCQYTWPSVSAWIEISKTEKRWLCRASVPTSGPTPVTKSICNTLPVKQFDLLFLHSWALSTGSETQKEHPAQRVCLCLSVWIPTEGTGWSWRLTGAPWWASQKNLHTRTDTHTPSALDSNIKKAEVKTCWEITCWCFYIYLKAMIS